MMMCRSRFLTPTHATPKTQAAFRALTAALQSKRCLPLRDAAASRLRSPLGVAECGPVLKRFEWAHGVQARTHPAASLHSERRLASYTPHRIIARAHSNPPRLRPRTFAVPSLSAERLPPVFPFFLSPQESVHKFILACMEDPSGDVARYALQGFVEGGARARRSSTEDATALLLNLRLTAGSPVFPHTPPAHRMPTEIS